MGRQDDSDPTDDKGNLESLIGQGALLNSFEERMLDPKGARLYKQDLKEARGYLQKRIFNAGTAGITTTVGGGIIGSYNALHATSHCIKEEPCTMDLAPAIMPGIIGFGLGTALIIGGIARSVSKTRARCQEFTSHYRERIGAHE